MKRILLAFCIWVAGTTVCTADPTILWTVGKMNVYLPVSELNVVYLYDVVGKRSLVGAETPVAEAWKLQLTAGGVTSTDGLASPFVGTHLALPNPVAAYAPLAGIHLGLFGGRDFHQNAWMGGLKASTSIFN